MSGAEEEDLEHAPSQFFDVLLLHPFDFLQRRFLAALNMDRSSNCLTVEHTVQGDVLEITH